MELDTKPFGKMDINERQRISFPRGILGFEHIREYALLNASQWPFYWLQAIEVPDLAFILIDPKIFRADYTVDVDDNDFSEIFLNPGDAENMLVFAIVTIPEDQKKMSANLQGPVVINREKKIGKQFISINPLWKTRHYILEELSEKGGKGC